MEANIDFIGKDGSQGVVANNLMQNSRLNPSNMRPWINPKDGKAYITHFKGGDAKKPENYVAKEVQTNATLRRDEWKTLDEAILTVAEDRLNGIQDLVEKGLTYNLGNAMGTTVLEYHRVSDALTADLTMDGITRGENDALDFETKYMPIPLIHVDYEINARSLEASRSLGNPLDTTLAERASRKVSEYLENMLFTDTSYTFGGGTIYSYTNHPDRNQVTLNDNWDDSATTPRDIFEDVRAMKAAALADKRYGPYMLYIPSNYEAVMDDDFEDTGQTSTKQTVRERLLKIGNLSGIKVVDSLPDDNVLLVQMTSDVVRLVNGLPLQNIQWDVEGRFLNKYKVLTIQVPQVRSDYNGSSGVIHLA